MRKLGKLNNESIVDSIELVESINSHIKFLLSNYEFDNDKYDKILISQNYINNFLKKYSSQKFTLLNTTNLPKEDFINDLYKCLKIENDLSGDIRKIWYNSITDFNSFNNGDDFNLIVHSNSHFRNALEKNNPFISTSLITDKSMGLYSDKICLSYKTDVICATDYDSTIYISKENDINIIDTNIKISHNIGQESVTKLMTPKLIEKRNISQCKLLNGEILNSDNNRVYNEVVIKNSKPNGIVMVVIFYLMNILKH